jgi:hypothetical protein
MAGWCQGFCTLCGTGCGQFCEEIKQLRERVERAKEALRKIAAKGKASPGDTKDEMARIYLAELERL